MPDNPLGDGQRCIQVRLEWRNRATGECQRELLPQASLNSQCSDVNTALTEIEYALDVLKLDGIGLYTNYAGAYLGDPKFRPLLEELNRRKVTVFVHPVEPPHFEEFGFGFPAPMVEYPFDTTRMVISLLRAGALKDLPDIQWITTHGSGAIPFLAQQRMLLVPIRNNIIFAGESAISGSRFGRHHTRMRRPPPAQDRGRRGREFADSKTAVMV